MKTKIYKIYGKTGHRQALSFEKSRKYNFSIDEDIRTIEFFNSDKTGTNDFCIVKITRPSLIDCENEIEGQLSDGFFENVNYGIVEEISEKELDILTR